MTNLIGQSIGRYHILEQLGEGGMAIVYKAYDTRLERDVAVKVIRTERLTIETMTKTLKRFEREAKSLAKLTHPNIVPITDYGEHDGKPYLVMPYLPGGTLKQQLGGKQIPWQDAIRLLLPVGRALHYAHQQGIVHRDVKPANILITQSGEPMLTDFGIAKILLDTEDTFELTGTGMGIGTPEYMSPEQFQGKNVDARTDVYALGVVLYEMVTGRKPYQADTPAAVLIKQATDPLPRPKSFASSLPDSVERVLLKALSKQADDRYQDMHQFAQALESITSQASPDDKLGHADSRPKTGHRWQRWLWVGIPILLLGVGLWIGRDVLLQNSGNLSDASSVQPTEAAPFLVVENLLESTLTNPTRAPIEAETSRPTANTATPDSKAFATLNSESTLTREKDGMVMIYVPAGTFQMGSELGDDDEKPVHEVFLDAFWIDQTEVTNTMYALCVKSGSCLGPSNTRNFRNNLLVNHPVVYVTWSHASNYCTWVGGRLPTEAEWEKAARGTDGRTYPWGNEIPNCSLSSYRGCATTTKPVASHPSGSSPYGALDMAGNVWEWVFDWYLADYYFFSPPTNPSGPSYGQNKVLRGGSWADDDINVFNSIRSSFRCGRCAPGSGSYHDVGFRCARSGEPNKSINCEYSIRPGENISQIAMKFNTNLSQIYRLDSSQTDFDRISVSEILVIKDISPQTCLDGGGQPQQPDPENDAAED